MSVAEVEHSSGLCVGSAICLYVSEGMESVVEREAAEAVGSSGAAGAESVGRRGSEPSRPSGGVVWTSVIDMSVVGGVGGAIWER